MTLIKQIEEAAPLNWRKVAELTSKPDFIQYGVTEEQVRWVAKILDLSYVFEKKPLTDDWI